MPSLKKDLLECYELWKGRGHLAHCAENESAAVDSDENSVVSNGSAGSMDI